MQGILVLSPRSSTYMYKLVSGLRWVMPKNGWTELWRKQKNIKNNNKIILIVRQVSLGNLTVYTDTFMHVSAKKEMCVWHQWSSLTFKIISLLWVEISHWQGWVYSIARYLHFCKLIDSLINMHGCIFYYSFLPWFAWWIFVSVLYMRPNFVKSEWFLATEQNNRTEQNFY